MKQKVLIGFPVGGSCHPAFTKSLLELQKFELTNPSDKYEVINIDYVGGLYVQDNRNELVDEALRLGADWLLQLDADESFEPQILRILMQTADKKTRPIVFGLYSNAVNPPGEASGGFILMDMIYKEVETGEYQFIVPPSEIKPFEIDAAGSGIMLTHTGVYKKLEYPWFIATYCLPTGKKRLQPMNEDIAFCRTARKRGYHLWCAPLAEATHFKNLAVKTSTFKHFMDRAQQVQEEMKKL
jgi:GT2 family glycosyltransferase